MFNSYRLGTRRWWGRGRVVLLSMGMDASLSAVVGSAAEITFEKMKSLHVKKWDKHADVAPRHVGPRVAVQSASDRRTVVDPL